MERILDRRDVWRQDKLDRLVRNNHHHCVARPVYGADVIKALTLPSKTCGGRGFNRGQGWKFCESMMTEKNPQKRAIYWKRTRSLAEALTSYEQRMRQLDDVLQRF